MTDAASPTAQDVPSSQEGEVDPRLLEILVCPVTHGPLEFDRTKGELISRSARLAYPIRDGVPIMLPEEAATAKAWNIQGAACPALSQAEFTANRYTALKTFDYDGIAIGRAAGDASCSDVKDSGGKGFLNDKVCQFTSPATLTVISKAGSFFFVPGVGQPASLVIHHDTPRCVMASNFTLKTE